MPVKIMTMMMLTMECRQWNLVQRWRWFVSCYCSARSGLGPRQLHEAVAGEPCGGGERWECDDDPDSGDRCNHVMWCDVRSPRNYDNHHVLATVSGNAVESQPSDRIMKKMIVDEKVAIELVTVWVCQSSHDRKFHQEINFDCKSCERQ